MIKGIAHVAYNVLDMDKALHFYCDILGFKKAFEIHDDNGNPWINYIKVSPSMFIELFYTAPGAKLATDGVTYSHLCLEVDDIHAIADHLKKNNIHLDVEPVQGKDFNFQCWAKDPDGNRIEFMQLDPRSPQMNA